MTPAKTKPTAVTANVFRRNVTCPDRTLEMLFSEKNKTTSSITIRNPPLATPW